VNPRPDVAASRRARQLWPLLVVAGGVLLGVAIAALGDNTWRLGCLVIGSALLVGAVIRLALPEREAGLLQVRSRAFDLVALLVGGVAIIALAIVVPGR
jgi:Protein of unknown function (DUF3017)